jgi:hypothetical protein
LEAGPDPLSAIRSGRRSSRLIQVNGPNSLRKRAATIDFAKQKDSAILRRMHEIVEHDEDFPRLDNLF